MAVEISTLLEAIPGVRRGRMRIAGTGITVHRIATWWNTGSTPEEIAANYSRVSLASVLAALTYYEANKAEIDAEIAADEVEEEELARVDRLGSTVGT